MRGLCLNIYASLVESFHRIDCSRLHILLTGLNSQVNLLAEANLQFNVWICGVRIAFQDGSGQQRYVRPCIRLACRTAEQVSFLFRAGHFLSLQWALQQLPRGHPLLLAYLIAQVTPCQSAREGVSVM